MPARRSLTVPALASTSTSRQLMSLRRSRDLLGRGDGLVHVLVEFPEAVHRREGDVEGPLRAAGHVERLFDDLDRLGADLDRLLAGRLVDADDVALRLAGALPVGHQPFHPPELVVSGEEGVLGLVRIRGVRRERHLRPHRRERTGHHPRRGCRRRESRRSDSRCGLGHERAQRQKGNSSAQHAPDHSTASPPGERGVQHAASKSCVTWRAEPWPR